MTIEIENYRGWEITFDTERDEFNAYSNNFDKETEKMRLIPLKKYIDDFIKKNTEFKPFDAEPIGPYQSKGFIKIIGIRKDGYFVKEGKNGAKEQVSGFDEKYYIVRNPDNDPIREQIKVLQQESSVINGKIRALEATLTGTPISEIKKQFIV